MRRRNVRCLRFADSGGYQDEDSSHGSTSNKSASERFLGQPRAFGFRDNGRFSSPNNPCYSNGSPGNPCCNYVSPTNRCCSSSPGTANPNNGCPRRLGGITSLLGHFICGPGCSSKDLSRNPGLTRKTDFASRPLVSSKKIMESASEREIAGSPSFSGSPPPHDSPPGRQQPLLVSNSLRRIIFID
eukprot:Gregarina_sp_Pseudo_9__2859@NODE_3087_length_757_cov_4_150418_g2815_i0_p1_GENE_NODE_3087_length_757_cov_4_150418_g2815_i0NODE_3087_length_757_cov_4_150418_g2815_i0_p1_ORF_typecomplete_len186_score11_64_NODE_3087_length_757_cov_4_150418_g2815_i0134691